jgi:hypothetical protein
VFVDNRTTPVTFWVGNNHGASIVKLEPIGAPLPGQTAQAADVDVSQAAVAKTISR